MQEYLADSMLVLIVQRFFFFCILEFLYMQFPCVHINWEQLNNLFSEAVNRLECAVSEFLL